MSMTNFIKIKLNGLIRRSYWYNNILFPDCKKFWSHNTFNLDVVNLGSNSGKYAFEYSEEHVKAANWAMGPQTLLADFEILKNYCSYLKNDAVVIIPLCPFTCLGGSSKYMPDKYYTVLKMMSIPCFDYRKKKVVMDMKKSPLKYYPLIEFGRDLVIAFKRIFHISTQKQTLTTIELENSAKSFMKGWMFEFSIMDFQNDLIMKNMDAYQDSLCILTDMINFCLERGFKPVLTIPPISKQLLIYITPAMRQFFIYDFVEKANVKKVPFLDYMNDHEFAENSRLFMNSVFLNRDGAVLFTKKILRDIKKVR